MIIKSTTLGLILGGVFCTLSLTACAQITITQETDEQRDKKISRLAKGCDINLKDGSKKNELACSLSKDLAGDNVDHSDWNTKYSSLEMGQSVETMFATVEQTNAVLLERYPAGKPKGLTSFVQSHMLEAGCTLKGSSPAGIELKQSAELNGVRTVWQCEAAGVSVYEARHDQPTKQSVKTVDRAYFNNPEKLVKTVRGGTVQYADVTFSAMYWYSPQYEISAEVIVPRDRYYDPKKIRNIIQKVASQLEPDPAAVGKAVRESSDTVSNKR